MWRQRRSGNGRTRRGRLEEISVSVAFVCESAKGPATKERSERMTGSQETNK
jgi:hypothetical protein